MSGDNLGARVDKLTGPGIFSGNMERFRKIVVPIEIIRIQAKKDASCPGYRIIR